MPKSLNLSKMSSILWMLLSSCAGVPPVPVFNPVAIIPSKNQAFECYLVDVDRILFRCAKKPVPMNSLKLDGSFALTAEDTSEIIQWAREVKAYAEKQCK